MARIGPLLKDARTARAISLDRVAEDTNIGLRYLSALEQDDFTIFPGEPYVVGFMRNYAEYLGLDGDGLIARYRAPEPVESIAAAAAPAAEAATEAAPTVPAPAEAATVPEPAQPGPAEPPAKAPRKGRRRSMDPKDPLDAILAAAPPADHAPGTVSSPAAAVQDTGATTRPAEVQPGAVKQGAVKQGAAPSGQPPRAESGQDSAAAVRDPGASSEGTPARRLGAWAIPAIVVAAALILVAAILLARRGGPDPDRNGARAPTEYRVEGMPFEKRLYPEDSVVFVIGQDLYKARLTAIDEAVAFETPFGPMKIPLGKDAEFDADLDGSPEVALAVVDFAKRNPAAGALVRLESRGADPVADTGTGSDVKVPQAAAASAAPQAATGPSTLFSSSRGPYPFVTTVTFRGPCMFRYESDRRDWVEKYYSKGETITINANNTLMMWASNARAARVSIQASGGKTAELELGGAGEISVKRIAWSQAAGGWALTASDVD